MKTAFLLILGLTFQAAAFADWIPVNRSRDEDDSYTSNTPRGYALRETYDEYGYERGRDTSIGGGAWAPLGE